MAFIFEKQDIEDLILIKPEFHFDNRGYFAEFYKSSEFKKNGIKEDFCQDNFSYSKKNVLRGLHFQKPPHFQSKLLTCLKGEILDFVVDLRKNSKSHKKIYKTVLSEENHNILYIPFGFAHGFVAKKDSLVLYKTSNEYNPQSECAISYKDDDLNLDLDLDFDVILSKKDESSSKLKEIGEIF